jgi:hypothetical protein
MGFDEKSKKKKSKKQGLKNYFGGFVLKNTLNKGCLKR